MPCPRCSFPVACWGLLGLLGSPQGAREPRSQGARGQEGTDKLSNEFKRVATIAKREHPDRHILFGMGSKIGGENSNNRAPKMGTQILVGMGSKTSREHSEKPSAQNADPSWDGLQNRWRKQPKLSTQNADTSGELLQNRWQNSKI